MAISHKSRVHQPIGYTAPVDLNLLGRVLQFKQGQYDAGEAKIQQEIDTAAALDVVRGVDKEYLNSKVNSLVQTTNNMGGVDLSDPGISNQIAGLSSQIYGDKNIINAVAGTKAFRYIQSHYKDLKEKKPKEWNPANEWYDTNKFSGWFNDERVGASLQGDAGKVTPFVRYDEDMNKLLEKIHLNPNISTDITDQGLKYVINGKEYVSPERITAVASKMLTPAQRSQIAIEGRYQFANVGTAELTKMYNEKLYAEVGVAKGELEAYEAKAKMALTEEDKESYKDLIGRKKSEIETLLAPVTKNPEQIKEELYLKTKLAGWADRYAYTKASTKIQMATDKMFVMKHNQDITEYNYKVAKDALDFKKDLAKDGLLMREDGSIVQDPNARQSKESSVSGTGLNIPSGGIPGLEKIPEGQGYNITENSLNLQQEEIAGKMNDLKVKYAQSIGWRQGDVNVTITDLMPDGHLSVDISPEMQKAMQAAFNALEARTRGEVVNYKNVDPKFKEFAKQYLELQKESEAISAYKKNVDEQIKKKYNITDIDVKRIESITNTKKQIAAELSKVTPTPFSRASEGQIKEISEKVARLRQHLSVINYPEGDDRAAKYLENYEAEKERAFASQSEVFQMPFVTMDDNKQQDVAKAMVNAISGGAMKAYSEDGKIIADVSKAQMNFKKMIPISKGYRMLEGKLKPVIKFSYTQGEGEDATTQLISVPVQKIQESIFGFNTGNLKPMAGYNFALRMNGKVEGLTTVTGKHDYELKYDLVKVTPDNPDDNRVWVRVYNKNNTGILLEKKEFDNYELAVNTMENIVNLDKITTIDAAIQNLNQMK